MLFSDLKLAEPLLRAVAAEGYSTATPVQAKAIPFALEGRDVLGCAQTGTGKTAAFALPILHRLASRENSTTNRRRVRCLVLCPTRELATQIGDSFRTYGKHLGLRHTVIFGGVGQNSQVQALRHGVDIVVATPGRLLDLINQNYIDLGAVEVLVLDEADRMLDMGFIHDVRRIVGKLPAARQTMLFSATMPDEVRRLADSLLRNPATVQIAPVKQTTESIAQSVYFVEKRNKPVLLAHLVNELPMTRTIVFTRTKHGADRVVRHLHTRGIRAEAIHGNKSQNARERALQNFKAGKIPLLIATDIASRGIDVDDITHVVNYDLTHEPETYVHRIGRTARAGASGSAVSFCDSEEVQNLRAIERLLRKTIPVVKDHPVYPKIEAGTPADGESGHRESRRPGQRQGPSGGGHRSGPPQHRTSHGAPAHPRSAPSHRAPAAAAPTFTAQGSPREGALRTNARPAQPGRGAPKRPHPLSHGRPAARRHA